MSRTVRKDCESLILGDVEAVFNCVKMAVVGVGHRPGGADGFGGESCFRNVPEAVERFRAY
jgi:hypothetical protein